jgi:DNA modification methylase
VSKLGLYSDDTERWALIEGETLSTLALLPEHSVEAVITDPPYGIDYHDEAWDGTSIRDGRTPSGSEAFERWNSEWAHACLRVLKPGAHLVSFGAPRTFHRLVAGVEDAGLQIRDQVLWVYGQGLPKSRRLPGGLGTSLKPAYEPILIARAPLAGTTGQTVERFGTGALNIEASRTPAPGQTNGYWPANLVLSHSSDCPAATIDSGSRGPSRLFYCAKATRAEREAGCEQLPEHARPTFEGPHRPLRIVRNIHPTVKPVALMRWLIRLAVPKEGVVLDPFAGSASTGIASVLEDRKFVGIEREGAYVDVACARLTHWSKELA